MSPVEHGMHELAFETSHEGQRSTRLRSPRELGAIRGGAGAEVKNVNETIVDEHLRERDLDSRPEDRPQRLSRARKGGDVFVVVRRVHDIPIRGERPRIPLVSPDASERGRANRDVADAPLVVDAQHVTIAADDEGAAAQSLVDASGGRGRRWRDHGASSVCGLERGGRRGLR